jgi:hypothetical protein
LPPARSKGKKHDGTLVGNQAKTATPRESDSPFFRYRTIRLGLRSLVNAISMPNDDQEPGENRLLIGDSRQSNHVQWDVVTPDSLGSCECWNNLICSGILACMTKVTQILSQIEQGDPSAADLLLPPVYEELRKLAAANLANEKPGHTLQATALVHEAYLRLVDVVPKVIDFGVAKAMSQAAPSNVGQM